MLAAAFSWAMTPLVWIFLILADIVCIVAFVCIIKYRDWELFVCFALIGIVLFSVGLFCGIGKEAQPPVRNYEIIVRENVHVIQDDAEPYLIYTIKGED